MKNNNVIREGSGIVYHYTSLDTFMKIMDGVKGNKFIFHGSDIFSMNDPTEFYHGYKKLWNLLPQIENDLYYKIRNQQIEIDIDIKVLDEKYKLSEVWKRYNYSTQDEWLAARFKEMRESYRTPFVISFSCQRDFLPMWSSYGDNGHGIALGIDVQAYYIKKKQGNGETWFDFSNYNAEDMHTLLVSYDKISLQHPLARIVQSGISSYVQELSKMIGNSEQTEVLQKWALDIIFNFSSALIKNKTYSYEEESRLVCYASRLEDIKYKINANKDVIPYIEVEIPVAKLKEIVIGPCCDYKSVKQMLVTRFKQLGISISEDALSKSGIPFR